MLSSHDLDLIRRDSALPGLAILLDEDAIAELVARHTGHIPTGVCITYLRYKPGTNCLAACDVETTLGTVRLTLKAHGPAAEAKVAKALSRRHFEGPLGTGVFASPSHGFVAAVFPNDAKLRSLGRFFGSPRAHRRIKRLLPVDAREMRVDLLSFKPERRVVARIADGTRPIATLRFSTPAAFARVARNAAAFERVAEVRTPGLLATDARHAAIVQGWVPGTPLEDLLRTGDSGTVMVEVGAALAALHGSSCSLIPGSGSPEHEERPLGEIAAGIAAVLPALEPLLERAIRLIANRHPWRTGRITPIHGDFHPGQVVMGDRVAFIDLDDARTDEAVLDVARFVADIERRAVCGSLDPDAPGRLSDAFLDGYASVSPEARYVPFESYLAAALLRLTPEPFRRRETDWAERTEAMLARVLQILGGRPRHASLPGPHVAGISPAPALDAQMPWLSDALDVSRATTAFARLSVTTRIGAAARLGRVTDAQLVRHKPGRRFLIEYRLAEHVGGPGCGLAVIGKSRARGLDRNTLRLVETLYADGFGPHAADGIRVPEPLGAVPEWGMWLQRRVAGRPAAALLGGPTGEIVATRCAEALHKFHVRAPVPERRHGLVEELDILRRRYDRFSAEASDWAARMTRILDGCVESAAALPTPSCSVSLHRDFYPDQVLVADDEVHLVDLDLNAAGDPALDVGNFMAHVIDHSLRTTGDADTLDSVAGAFVDRYRTLSGLPAASAEIWTTLALARLVTISTLFPDRRQWTRQLMERCEARIQWGAAPQKSRPSTPTTRCGK